MSSYILQAPDYWHAFNGGGGGSGAPQQQQMPMQSRQVSKLFTNQEGSAEQLRSPAGSGIGRIAEVELPAGLEAEMGIGGMMAEMR